MATNNLGNNQIQPAAQPLSTFITPSMVEPARPAQPSSINSPSGYALIQTGNRGNVEGANNGLRLAQALGEFNQNLVKTVTEGLGMYASGQYKKGQSEAFRASLLAQRQMEQGGREYAAENRVLAMKDPIAGMAMDTVNPFRSAGRRNALSQVAGQQIGSALELAYSNNRAELAKLDPSDPKINEIKAKAVDGILGRYGLTEDDPGFMDYVLPNLNRGWERVTAQQQSDRKDYLKSTMLTTLPLTMRSMAVDLKKQGLSDAQVAQQLTRHMDGELATLGLPGESVEMAKKAGWAMLEDALTKDENGEPHSELLNIYRNIEVGEPTPNGFRPTLGSLFAPDLEERAYRDEERAWSRSERGREVASRNFNSDLSEALLGLEDGPDKEAAIQEFIASDDPRYAGLEVGERMEIAQNANKRAEALDALAYSPEDNEAWLLDQEEKFGSAWDPAGSMDEFREREGAIPDGPLREEFRRRYLALRKQKNAESDDMPDSLINKSVADRIKINLEREYPGLGPEIQRAQAAGVDLGAYLQNKSGDAAESASRQRSAYTKHVYAALQTAKAAKGGPLTALEAQETIDKALGEYGKSDPKAAAAALFPGGVTSGAPTSVPGGKNPSPAGGAASGAAPKTEGKAAPPPGPTFKTNALPGAPVERLRNWKNERIVDPGSLKAAAEAALNGGDYPASLRKAAEKAGTTPGRFVLDQIKLLGPDAFKFTPEQEKQLLRQGQSRASAQRYADGIAPVVSRRADAPEQGYLAKAGSWALNLITGATPTYAAEGPPGFRASMTPRPRRSEPRVGGGSRYIATTGFGKSADGQTQTLHGIVGRNGYDANHGAGNDHVHHATDAKTALALASYLKRRGWPITEFGGWNQRVGGHSKTGGHYSNEAFDIPVGVERHAEVMRDIDAFYAGKTAPAPSRRTPTRSRTTAPKGPEGWGMVKTAAAVAGVKFPELAAAMWALESSWGSKPSGRHNYWNQKGAGKTVNTTEYVGGKPTGMPDQFLNFKSFGAALDHLATRWFKDFKGYRGINNARNLNEAIQMLAQQGYATDPNYGVKLRRIMRQQGVRI